MKYRLKVSTIEAFQYEDYDGLTDMDGTIPTAENNFLNGKYPDWAKQAYEEKNIYYYPRSNMLFVKVVRDRVMRCYDGDYVCRTANGFLVHRKESFEAAFERM